MSAEFRSVQTRMWREDDWFQNQPTDARLLFIYLFTNPSASVSGIYRLPLRTMAFESGLSVERVTELLMQFSKENKAHYEDGVIWVVKMRDNQLPAKKELSKQILTHLATEIEKIPSGHLKNLYLEAYGYPMDTLSRRSAYPSDVLDTITDTNTDTVTNTADEKKDVVVVADSPEVKRYRHACDLIEGNGFGMLTQLVSEQVHELVDEYPDEWIDYAFRVAVNANIRRVDYVMGVLRKLKANGTNPLTPHVNGSGTSAVSFSLSEVMGD